MQRASLQTLNDSRIIGAMSYWRWMQLPRFGLDVRPPLDNVRLAALAPSIPYGGRILKKVVEPGLFCFQPQSYQWLAAAGGAT